jgi:hypothetical protein
VRSPRRGASCRATSACAATARGRTRQAAAQTKAQHNGSARCRARRGEEGGGGGRGEGHGIADSTEVSAVQGGTQSDDDFVHVPCLAHLPADTVTTLQDCVSQQRCGTSAERRQRCALRQLFPSMRRQRVHRVALSLKRKCDARRIQRAVQPTPPRLCRGRVVCLFVRTESGGPQHRMCLRCASISW